MNAHYGDVALVKAGLAPLAAPHEAREPFGRVEQTDDLARVARRAIVAGAIASRHDGRVSRSLRIADERKKGPALSDA